MVASGLDIKANYYKRPFDLSILIAAHVLLCPIWVLLWVWIPALIWISDRGPVFFSQTRAGKNGKYFTLLKFRTMVSNAEISGPVWTVNRDKRVTPIGRILRKTALDELPGLISILKGDMSFVGPRALDIKEQKMLEQEVVGFESRLQVMPGLTGLAQVKDKYDVATDKLYYDLQYIEHMSIWLDMKLLIISIRNTILGKWDQRGGKEA